MRGSNKSRIFVIGLDGGTWEVLTPMIERGLMPNLKRLIGEGASGTLLSTIPPFTMPAWASFITGTNPGKHGVLSFFQVGPNDYETRPESPLVNSRAVAGTALWDYLSTNELEIGVVNVPLTYPVSPVRGFMISGMLTPPGSRNFTYPEALVNRLDRYMIDIGYFGENNHLQSKLSQRNKGDLLDEILFMHQQRTVNCLRLLDTHQNLDFFMVVFTGFDRVCHSFWEQLCGAPSPAGGEATKKEKRIRAKLDEYFAELDGSIKRILERTDDQTFCFLISDHGFGPAPAKEVYLNNWLMEKGYLELRAGDVTDMRFWLAKTGLNKEALKRWLGKVLPQRIYGRLEKSIRAGEPLIDWSRTRAFTTPMYTFTCGIGINAKGVKPQGIVEPGREYEELRERLMRELPSLADPETGKAMVERVYRREELYRGDDLRAFPDLVVSFQPDYTATKQISNSVLKKKPAASRSGDHIREGIFIAHGRFVRNERLTRPVELMDQFPTYLYIYGLPAAEALDGRVLGEIFTEEYRAGKRPASRPTAHEHEG